MKYIISPVAEQDIDEITSYIAVDNMDAALKLLDSVHEAIAMLAENPYMGYQREEIADKSLRFWPFKWHYLIIYKPSDPIEIIRVMSGYRDISSLLN